MTLLIWSEGMHFRGFLLISFAPHPTVPDWLWGPVEQLTLPGCPAHAPRRVRKSVLCLLLTCWGHAPSHSIGDTLHLALTCSYIHSHLAVQGLGRPYWLCDSGPIGTAHSSRHNKAGMVPLPQWPLVVTCCFLCRQGAAGGDAPCCEAKGTVRGPGRLAPGLPEGPRCLSEW